MSRVLGLLVACVILAILRVALGALVVALLLALLCTFAARPRETLIFIGALGFLGLACAQPVACIVMLGTVGVVAVFANAKAKPGEQVLLTDGREHHSN